MLVLSRKAGQRILIGDEIAVTVVRIAPGVVRLGVDAPKSMPVVREEIAREKITEPAATAAKDGNTTTAASKLRAPK